MERSQGSSPQGAAFGRAEGTIDGGSAAPLWAQKTGEASSGYCALTRQAWVHSRAQWLPMEFFEDEARRDLALHGRVLRWILRSLVPTRWAFSSAPTSGWFGIRQSQPNAPPPSPQSADMSKHVFAVDTDDGERDIGDAF